MIDTARRLFTEKGFAETTMSDIASETGVKRSTLHYYFANKDVMFQAVFGTIVESLVPRLQEIMRSDLPLMERLGLVADEYFGMFAENPSMPRFVMSEIQRDVDHLIDTARTLHLDKVFSLIRDALAAEMAEGKIRKVPFPDEKPVCLVVQDERRRISRNACRMEKILPAPNGKPAAGVAAAHVL